MSTNRTEIHYAPAAYRDLAEIDAYFSQVGGEPLAERMLAALEETAKLLTQFPNIGVQWSYRTGLRLTRRFPITSPFERWIIFYTVRPNFRIERVLHGSRNLERLVRR